MIQSKCSGFPPGRWGVPSVAPACSWYDVTLNALKEEKDQHRCADVGLHGAVVTCDFLAYHCTHSSACVSAALG